MAVLSLPLSFNNSFWSHDYRKGVEVLFKKLEQGVAENDEIVVFIRSRADAETQMASALSNPPTVNPAGSGFGADDGASLLMTFRGLHAEAASQAQAHLNVAKELESLVVDPFDQWAQGYKARIKQSRGVVLDQWLKAYENAQGDVAKLKHQYLAKTRKADEAEDDAKFAPNSEGTGADRYTTSPRLRPSDARAPPQRTASVSERIAARLKEIQKRAAGAPTPSESKEALVDEPASEKDLPPLDKGKGKAVEEVSSPINIGSPVSLSPKEAVHDIRPPESPMPPMPPEPMLLAGLSLPPVAVSQLLTRAASELNLRSVRFPLIGEYQGCFTGEEFVVWLNENVQGFGGSLDRAEDAAKELTERDGLLRRIGEFGNEFENSDDAWYQFRSKAFELGGHQSDTPLSPISTSGGRLAVQPENILKRTNNFVNLVSKALAANNSNEPAWVRARKEAEDADKNYRIATRQLDRQRLGLEERLEDTLKTLQRWEMERLRAVKTVLLQYQGTLSNFPKTLESIIERQTTLIAAYQPETDLTALVERYRTGPFRPHSHLYESISHDESDVVFGIDLRKWAEGGWITEVMSPDGSEGGRKEDVPEVLTAMLEALEHKYKELANDDEKRKSWIYEVPLASTHGLRESLNAVFPEQQRKEKPIPEDLFKPYDAPVLAATIKLWLLELEPPVATYEAWDEFKKLYPTHGRIPQVEGEESEGQEKKLAEVSSALLKLPRVQLHVLDRIVKHLKTLIDTTTTEEPNEVYVTKLALSIGRTILRPKVETEISIQDRHPTLLFIDLVNNYEAILPPTVTRKKRESQRKLPIRKRTAMVDMRSTRSNRISASGLHHFLPKTKSPEVPPVPSLPSTISPSDSIPPPPPIVPATSAVPPPPPIAQPKPIPPPPSLDQITPPPAAAQPSADDNLPPRPAFKEPPPEDDDLPPRPTFRDPPPEPEDEAIPPRPNFAEPPAEESDSPSAEAKMAVTPPTPNNNVKSGGSPSSPSPPPTDEQSLNAARTSVSRSSSGGIARSGRITRGPRAPGGGSVSSMVQNINRNSLPGSPTSPSSPSTKRFSGGAGGGSGSRPSSVLGRSAAFSRRTMHSDAEDDIVEKK